MRHFYLSIEFNNYNQKLQEEIIELGYKPAATILDKFLSLIDLIFELYGDSEKNERNLLIIQLCIINAVGKVFPNKFTKQTRTKLEKESFLLAFSRLIQLTRYSDNFGSTFFVDALTEHFMIVAKLSLSDINLTQITFHTFLNNIGSAQCIKEFERIMGLVIQGYLNFPDYSIITMTVNAILHDYCVMKQDKLKHKLKDLQFIFLKEVSK